MAEQSSERFPYQIEINLAEIPVRLQLQYVEAYRYFGSFCLSQSDQNNSANHSFSDNMLFLSEKDWLLLNKNGFRRCGQVEASFMASYCSDVLLHHNRCIIHAAAFRDLEKAWIIAADPGVGKSTQIRTLQELYPGVFSVICGDRPVLECRNDGSVMVHPSPWNGKEFWGGAQAAPLAGIICLQRGEEDRVSLMKKKDAILPVYRSLIQSAATEEIVRLSAAFADTLLQRVPVWTFVNKDIPESTQLLYQRVLKEGTE